MSEKLPKLVFTSVVRGSQQGESHGGIFVVDFESRSGDQVVDWNTSDIDFDGRGADRGLRGITFDGDDIYIAASDELFCYGRDWEISNSYKNRYLKHSHEIVRKGRHIFVTSTGFDSILRFDLETKKFDWGFRLTREYDKWSGYSFDPQTNSGPREPHAVGACGAESPRHFLYAGHVAGRWRYGFQCRNRRCRYP